MSEQFDLVVKPAAGSIASNIADLEAWVKSVTEPYIGQVVTEDQTKFAKKDLADLRKLKTMLEDERKKAKAIIMEPYTQFESMYKKAVASLDEAIIGIDRQVKEIEAAARKKREEDTIAFIRQAAQDIGGNKMDKVFWRDDILTWFVDPSWLLASTARTKVEKEIREKIMAVSRDIYAIETAAGDDYAPCLEIYYQTGVLASALEKKQALDAIRREKEEAERAKAQEAEAQAAETAGMTVQTSSGEHKEEDLPPYVTPIADRIFFDIPIEPEDETQKELMRVPAVLVFPKYKKHLVREIMTKAGIKILKPSSKEDK